APVPKTLPECAPLKDTSGNTVPRDLFKNKHTALFFFSIYSSDSEKLLVIMEEINQEVSNTGLPFALVGVNIDPSANEVQDFLRSIQVTYQILMDTSLALTGKFSVKKVPALFLVQPDLKITFNMPGFQPADKKTILLKIQELIKTAENEQPRTAHKTEDTYGVKSLVTSGFKDIKFSPSSQSLLVYISPEGDLWVYNTRTKKREKLASRVSTAEWSPKDEAVVFSLSDKTGLWMKDLNEVEAVRISPFGYAPVWSPDGAYIAFRMHESEVWIYSTGEKKHWRLKVDGINFSWSADGKLLLVKDKQGHAWLISPRAKMSVIKALQK
ncbi:MAG: thioredoxin-like domain-containing protein, partial [bacterium]